jgi:sugar-specific transcriptional regulator TrmB
MPVEGTLQKLGLSKQESEVYVAAVKLGVAKASEIAQKCTLGRSGVYYTLKLLQEKGFISEVIRSGVNYYSAASPKRLLEIIEEERQQKKELITSILPELHDLHTTSLARPQIEVYEGVEGFKTVFSKLLDKEDQELRCYLSASILKFMPQFHVQFRRRRKEHNIRIKTITERTPEMDEIRKVDKKELRTTRYNNGLLTGTSILQYILDDAVVIIKANKNEQIATYIREKEFAQLQRNLFEKHWQEST